MKKQSLKYAVILGNLGNTRDRFCGQYKPKVTPREMLRRAMKIPGVAGVELVGTWDVHPRNYRELKKALEDAAWQCVSIIPDLFTRPEFGKGAFSNPSKAIRQKAIHAVRTMCDIALEMACPLINLWPGQDGYDYLLTADYEKERAWECEAVREVAEQYSQLRFALEYKPKEPRTHSYLARMADTLLLAQATGCPNVGVTIDTGHAFVAGEVVAEQIVLARQAGNRLFHMHFNDNFAAWDDDMIVGTVHTVAYLEMLYWLDRTGYAGWLSMDQYPYREDAAAAIGESVQWVNAFRTLVVSRRKDFDALIAKNDPVSTSRFLREVLIGGRADGPRRHGGHV